MLFLLLYMEQMQGRALLLSLQSQVEKEKQGSLLIMKWEWLIELLEEKRRFQQMNG